MARKPRTDAEEFPPAPPDLDAPPYTPVDWESYYKDEVEAAADGMMFQPGYVPQKGKPVRGVIDLDAPGQPHWLSGRRKRTTPKPE